MEEKQENKKEEKKDSPGSDNASSHPEAPPPQGNAPLEGKTNNPSDSADAKVVLDAIEKGEGSAKSGAQSPQEGSPSPPPQDNVLEPALPVDEPPSLGESKDDPIAHLDEILKKYKERKSQNS